MKTRTTRTRRLLAAATLAALPLVAGALQNGPEPTTTDTDRARHVTERQNGPRWFIATGRPMLIAPTCSLGSGWGGAACLIRAL